MTLPKLNPAAAPYAGREALEAEVARRISATADRIAGTPGAPVTRILPASGDDDLDPGPSADLPASAIAGTGDGVRAEAGDCADPVPLAPGAVQGALRAMFARAGRLDAAQARRQRFEQSIAPRMRASGFPARYIHDLTDWKCGPQEAVYRFCEERFQEIGAIVALVGERGVGKTFIAAQLCQRRVEAWFSYYEQDAARRPATGPRGPGRYLKLTDLIARFKPLYADFGSTEIERLMAERDKLCRESLLCLDELHECEDQRLKSRILTDILDRRYAARLDTLVISNEVEPAFRQTIGSSALSRITEHGEIITCRWPSWRAGGRSTAAAAAAATAADVSAAPASFPTAIPPPAAPEAATITHR